MMKKTIITLAAVAFMAMTPVIVSAGSPLDALSGLVTAVTSTSKFELSALEGQWDYQSPAISFKSDATLNKIGGAAASVALENKLKEYYNQIGLNTMQLTVDADAKFEMKIKAIKLKGTISKDGDEGNLVFNFSAFGKIPLGKVSAKAQKSANGVLTLTWDVSRLVAIVSKIASVANLTSVNALVGILNSYDGIYAGAKLKKTASAPATTTQTSPETAPTQSSGSSKLGNAINGLLKKSR